jgi:uncharacterized coiled-coil DUF342 family protein
MGVSARSPGLGCKPCAFFLLNFSHDFCMLILFKSFQIESMMPRIKEPEIGSKEIPDYKSPASRIVRSLRNAYNNIREKVAEKSSQLDSARGKLRDVTRSRDEWKNEAKDLQAQLKELQKKHLTTELELEKLKKK